MAIQQAHTTCSDLVVGIPRLCPAMVDLNSVSGLRPGLNFLSFPKWRLGVGEGVTLSFLHLQDTFLMWYLYTMGFYAAMKKNEMLSFAGKWMELENIILSEVSLAQKTKNPMFSLICGH
jgi:hypothetical protein